jgi:hypothetical protein
VTFQTSGKGAASWGTLFLVPAAIPVLPPFDEPTETLEEAVQEQLDFGAQLKHQSRQLSQLAKRQDVLYAEVHNLRGDVGRIANGQLVCNGLMDLFNRRMKKMMEAFKVADVEDAELIEKALL